MNEMYIVIEISMPEYETGSVKNIQAFESSSDAVKMRDDLNDENTCNDSWYEVILETM